MNMKRKKVKQIGMIREYSKWKSDILDKNLNMARIGSIVELVEEYPFNRKLVKGVRGKIVGIDRYPSLLFYVNFQGAKNVGVFAKRFKVIKI